MTAEIPPSSPAGPRLPSRRSQAAFTLVEVLVSLTVLSMLLLISAQVIGQVQNTWTASNARVSQFREARTAFDILTRNLSQATLNTYVDYDFNYLKDNIKTASTAGAPSQYVRKSDLQFKCGPAEDLIPDVGGRPYVPGSAVFFQAPLGVSQQPELAGLDRLLCGRGYFVQFSSDAFFVPPFLPPGQLRYRYRLMEFCPPAESNLVYATRNDNGNGNGNGNAPSWFDDAGAEMNPEENPLNLSLNRPVADNIVALLISPRQEGGQPWIQGTATFDSRVGPDTGNQGNKHLLPPMLKIVLVAIDERSAQRLSNFETVETPPLQDQLNAFQAAAGEEISDADLEAALQQLKTDFIKNNINFRVFSTTVQIRGSKWSTL